MKPDMAVVWVGALVGLPHSMGALRIGPVACRQVVGNALSGYQIIVPRSQVSDYVAAGRPAGMWAYTALRVAEGIVRVGVDTDERTIPNELGVPSAEVSLDKGCYPGQETVAKVYNIGAPPRRLVRLHLDGSGEELPVTGAEIRVLDASTERMNVAYGVTDVAVERAGATHGGGRNQIQEGQDGQGGERRDGLDGREGRTGQVGESVSRTMGVLGSVAYHHHLGPIGLALLDRRVEDTETVLVSGVPATIEPLMRATRSQPRSSLGKLSLGRR